MLIRNLLLAACATAALYAQTPPAAPAQPGGRGGRGGRGAAPAGGGGGFANAYPQHPPADPAVIERGKAIYSSQCAFCHGQDARGGSEGGPNLIRSEVVLKDKNGETIGQVTAEGRTGMPKFNFTASQLSDLAGFLHSFRVSGYDASRNRPINIVVGDAKAGQAYFQAKCASCHSATGDLKGIASKFQDPRALQQFWLMPGGGGRFGGPAPSNLPPTTATITLANGKTAEGRLTRLSDFLVTITDADGMQRTFRRDGDTPKVVVHDPLEPHRELLKVYTDKDIHDLTAYLVTLK
jgi:cytochrome c oxidase cbb3-type subunit III